VPFGLKIRRSLKIENVVDQVFIKTHFLNCEASHPVIKIMETFNPLKFSNPLKNTLLVLIYYTIYSVAGSKKF
jgi:hypothetical protein